jgi:glucose-6-phosphate dehydrogenase assembly protein OpcA
MEIERFTGGEDLPVDVAAIEQELAALWMAAQGPENGEPAVMRASALNLVVPCAGHVVEEARAVVAELVSTHPARVLLLVSEPGPAAVPMTASVSAFCHRLGTEPRQVCCELITLRARGRAEEHLADAVLALLVPDLPVAVWWPRGLPRVGSDSSTSSLPERLAPLADRWIIDTAATQDAAALSQTAARFAPRAGGTPLGSSVHDLAWMRLLPWRELTAQFFDPRAFRARLQELDLLEVSTSASPPPGAEALLWIAWLAGRLGWQPAPAAEPGRTDWRFVRPGGGEGRARVLSSEPASTSQPPLAPAKAEGARAPAAKGRGAGLDPGMGAGGDALEGVRLQATPSETTFTIARTPGTDCVTLTVTTRGACPLPRAVSLPRPRTAQLLAASLDEPHADPLYLAALVLAAELAGSRQ